MENSCIQEEKRPLASHEMSQEKITVSKIGRAGKLINTGAKVGVNYMKHYASRLTGNSSKDNLEEENAKDIYNAFSQLKGGPLKVAQMLSMGDQVLPKAYVKQFEKSQNEVDPLSYPLVRKIIRKAFGKNPESIFDDFSKEAVNAASIGQVHLGFIGKKKYAVKIQYPGVAESLKSDLRLIAPVATQFLGFKKSEIAPYLEEVEAKLMEETDYEQELLNGLRIIKGCRSLEGIVFPDFEKSLSNKRVITMSWIEGLSVKEWLQTNPTQEERNSIGQRLWNFYQHQIHDLKIMHADPHPGNFLIDQKNRLGIIDFGCVKAIPDDFYHSYLNLLKAGMDDMYSLEFQKALISLDLLKSDENESEKALLLDTFAKMFSLVAKPLFSESFDFSDDTYFKQIFEQGEELSKNSEMRAISARGSKHFIYFNRTYFGLYQLLSQIKANVKTGGWL